MGFVKKLIKDRIEISTTLEKIVKNIEDLVINIEYLIETLDHKSYLMGKK
jgi:hypothetical protein